jgi:transmembrane sensor
MNERDTHPPGDDQLFEEAAGWFARMRGPDAEHSRGAFEAWLSRSALHRRAYNRAAEIFAMGKLLSDDGEAKFAKAATRRPERRTAALAVLSALVLALVASLAVQSTWRTGRAPARTANPLPPAEVVQLTARGASNPTSLSDGSLVRLARGAEIAVRFSREVRQLTLTRGFARFQVAHEKRAFIVYAGGGSVTAHGTIFDVGLTPDRRVSVRLIQGMVEVTIPSARPGTGQHTISQRLHPGERISFTAVSPVGTKLPSTRQAEMPFTAPVPPTVAQDYDDVRLGELIGAANRGATRPIRLAEPALGEHRISGRFRIDDTELLAERLAGLFNLVLDRGNPAVLVLKRQSARK